MISDDIYAQINSRYPNRSVRIEVSEDGENGCDIFYEKGSPKQTGSKTFAESQSAGLN